MDCAGEDAERYLNDAIDQDSTTVYQEYVEEEAHAADSFLNMSGDGIAEEDDNDFVPRHEQPVPSENHVGASSGSKKSRSKGKRRQTKKMEGRQVTQMDAEEASSKFTTQCGVVVWVKPYWEEFKEYKFFEEAQQLSEKNKINAAAKIYNHCLGPGGYKKAIQKWQKREQDLMDRGIQPVTWDWLERSEQWLFANGVTLKQEDGTLVVPLAMEEMARNLDVAIQEAKEGTFEPHKENDELTRALQNPEHPRRARGIGVVPWKVSWAGDSTYKTHRKSKAEQEDKLYALQGNMTRKVQ
ncbi:transposon protein, putative, CACTA, En/Spm sub-class [Panicum miliaceum]|uniref:Transposon protein, putative, CACTA, En/Spm sub-class n=1 Tax=Panicum miliaceum TaxID=4540 RepID=A0A3L6S9M6_PANMI|nr:transposon protein, putative, CACTA, En/Spm sub-class [Panicum miliaceum]